MAFTGAILAANSKAAAKAPKTSLRRRICTQEGALGVMPTDRRQGYPMPNEPGRALLPDWEAVLSQARSGLSRMWRTGVTSLPSEVPLALVTKWLASRRLRANCLTDMGRS